MDKHTPGPWAAKPSKYRDGEIIVQAGMPSNRVLACFGDDGAPDEIDIANAHLIAAAPEMLAALEEMVGIYGDMRTNVPHLDRARAAIAKARGEV